MKDLNMNEEKVQLEEEKVEGLLKTDSGVEYTEHPFKNKITGEERTLRLFRTLKPERLSDEGETKEEYGIRRKFNRNIIAHIKKGRMNWDPYPFGKTTKGMTKNKKNVEFLKALKEQMEARKETATEEIKKED